MRRYRLALCAVTTCVTLATSSLTVSASVVHRTRTCSQIAAHWNTSKLVDQLLVAPVDLSALAQARSEVAQGVGGILLTGSPSANLAQQLHNVIGAAPDANAPLVMTDEEGGSVQRLSTLVAGVPSARVMGATMSPAQIQQLGKHLGESMKSLGLTMDLAPVADIDAMPGPNTTDADGTRSFSGTSVTAAADAISFARGLVQSGVVPVIKHFPGLGGASGNTDLSAARTLPWSTLTRSGLVPFVDAIRAKLPAIMISNASIPGLSKLPASLSREVITGELRDRLHFKGLVMTDSLTAVSITSAGYSLPRAVVTSLEAGADMVLFNASTASLGRTIQQITQAVISAVATKHLSRAQLTADAAIVLATKHFDRCSAQA